MYNPEKIKKGLIILSENSFNGEYNAVSDYIHDLEQEENRLLKEKQEAQDKLHRRNLQIKDLKIVQEKYTNLRLALTIKGKLTYEEYQEGVKTGQF